MPSDRRKHRIRHEAGPVAADVENENKSSSAIINNEEPINGKKEIPATVKIIDQPVSNKPNSKEKTVKTKSSNGRIKIGGKNQKNQHTNDQKSSVSFAEEKQYESVTIMGAPQDAPPQEKVLPQYQRRPLMSNWLKYEDMPREINIEEGDDYLVGEDFSEVLELYGAPESSKGGYLQLKSEMSWGDQDSKHLENHGMGALKVLDLCSALATIPFHEQLKISENLLPSHDIHLWTNTACENRKVYHPNKAYASNIEVNEKILESLRLTDSDTIRLPSEDRTPSPQELNSRDIMTKFADSFPKEETDVDLNNFSTQDPGTQSPPERESPILNNSSEIKSNSSNENRPKVSASNIENNSCKSSGKKFNFGLQSQSSSVPPTRDVVVTSPLSSAERCSPTKQLPSVQETSKESPPMVSLDGPLAPPPPSSVLVGNSLVSKSETEDLEDWLDSVLDD